MTKANLINAWFLNNNLTPNYCFEKTINSYKCILYIPYIDKNIIDYGDTKSLAKEKVIAKAFDVLSNTYHIDNAVDYHLKTEGNKKILIVTVH